MVLRKMQILVLLVVPGCTRVTIPEPDAGAADATVDTSLPDSATADQGTDAPMRTATS